MSSVIKTSGLLAAAFTLLAAGTARASTINVTVPFSFELQGQTLPAGEYRVTNDEGIVTFCGEKPLHGCLNVMTEPASGVDPKGDIPAVTFTRDSSGYRVADVWINELDGREIKAPGTHHR